MDIVQNSNFNCDYFPPSSVPYRIYLHTNKYARGTTDSQTWCCSVGLGTDGKGNICNSSSIVECWFFAGEPYLPADA
jgi:hypothetical protein